MSFLNKMGNKYQIDVHNREGMLEKLDLHNIKEYWEGRDKVKQAKEWIDILAPMGTSVINRGEVLAIVEEAARGTLNACKAIYEPLIDKEKMRKVEGYGPNDYLTDLKGLEDIPSLFEESTEGDKVL